MRNTMQQPVIQPRVKKQVTPSVVDPATARPFTLDQELEPFGSWVGDPIWVPPKDNSKALAESMLGLSRPFTSKEKRWASVVDKHRAEFTQVRELDLYRASIRLPKGKFFVSVIEQENFDQITDAIPNCVQTRLDEFMEGPGKRRGVRIYYLKPLCVEVDEQLILTTRENINSAIGKIQEEVFAEYREQAFVQRPFNALIAAGNLALALPRSLVNYLVKRRKKALDAYQARLEFKRRKTALGAARTYRKCRTTDCTFDDMLELTNPLKREDVIEQYCVEQELSAAKRAHLLQIAAGTVPWFVALSLGASFAASLGMVIAAPPLVVCDPAFVAEMPGSGGVLLKIGHFDEVGGITHIEI